MKQTTKTIIASTLIATTIGTTTLEAQACDASAVMEVTQQASMAAGPLAPAVLLIGGTVAVGTGIVVGIKNKSTLPKIYQSYGHLPDRWRPNSVIEKLNPQGKIIQRRFYGPAGKPEFDIDLNNHGTPEYHPFGFGGAHKHVFRGSKRMRGQELTQEEYDKYIKQFDSKQADRMRVEYKENK